MQGEEIATTAMVARMIKDHTGRESFN